MRRKVHALVLIAQQQCQALAAPAGTQAGHFGGRGVRAQVRLQRLARGAHLAADHDCKVCGLRYLEAAGYALRLWSIVKTQKCALLLHNEKGAICNWDSLYCKCTTCHSRGVLASAISQIQNVTWRGNCSRDVSAAGSHHPHGQKELKVGALYVVFLEVAI